MPAAGGTCSAVDLDLMEKYPDLTVSPNFRSTPNKIGDALYAPNGAGSAVGSPAHTLILATASGQFSDVYQHVVEEANTYSKQGGTVNPLVKQTWFFSNTRCSLFHELHCLVWQPLV